MNTQNEKLYLSDKFYLNKIDGLGIINFGVFINIGSLHDNKQLGISHLLEHLILQNIQKEINKNNLVKAIVNAYTTREYTFYNFVCRKENFDFCLATFFNSLFKCKFNQQDLSTQKDIIYKEIDINIKKESLLRNFLLSNCFDNHIKPICGTKESVSNITINEIKNHYLNYFKSKYVITSTGDFNCFELKNKIENLVSYTKLSNNYLSYNPLISDIKNNIFNNDIMTLSNNGLLHRIYLIPTFKDLKEKVLFSLIITLLTGGMDSDLYKMFYSNDKSSYYINSYYLSIGSHIFYSIDVQATNNIPLLSQKLREAIFKRINNGISENELENIKYLYLIQDARSKEGSFYLMEENGKRVLYNEDIVEKEEDILKSIRVSDFNDYYKKCFLNNNYIDLI